MIFIISNILSGLLMIVPLLIAVAYTTLMERKVIAAMQLRKGPNVVGPFGMLQPLADGLKLMLKELITLLKKLQTEDFFYLKLRNNYLMKKQEIKD